MMLAQGAHWQAMTLKTVRRLQIATIDSFLPDSSSFLSNFLIILLEWIWRMRANYALSLSAMKSYFHVAKRKTHFRLRGPRRRNLRQSVPLYVRANRRHCYPLSFTDYLPCISKYISITLSIISVKITGFNFCRTTICHILTHNLKAGQRILANLQHQSIVGL